MKISSFFIFLFFTFSVLNGFADDDCPKRDFGNPLKQEKQEHYKIGKTISEVLCLLGYKSVNDQKQFLNYLKEYAKKQKDWNPEFADMLDDVEYHNFDLYSVNSTNGIWEVLKINMSATYENFYFFFKKKGNSYDLVRKEPLEVNSKYCDSYPEYLDFFGREFFKISNSEGGTGAFVASFNLFAVDSNGYTEVLDYPVTGYYSVCASEYDVFFKAGSIDSVKDGAEDILQIPLTINFTTPGCGGFSEDVEKTDLFTKKFRLCFKPDRKNRSFLIDKGRSEIKGELKDFNLLFCSDEEFFFNFYYSDLEMIAKGKNVPRKQWLLKFLRVLQTNKYIALKKAEEKEKIVNLLKLTGNN